MARLRDARCSFCGKRRDQVKKLVAGPGVFICNNCVALCNEIIANDEPPPTPSPGDSSAGWIRRRFPRPRRPLKSEALT